MLSFEDVHYLGQTISDLKMLVEYIDALIDRNKDFGEEWTTLVIIRVNILDTINRIKEMVDASE